MLSRRITGWKKLWPFGHTRRGVVQPDLIADLVQRSGLESGVEPVTSQPAADQGPVAVFDEAVIVLVPGATAGKPSSREPFPVETHEMGVEELAAVIGVDFQNREGQTEIAARESILHSPIAAAQDGSHLTHPSGVQSDQPVATSTK